MGQRSEVKSQSDRNLGIVVPKVLSHESPPPEPPELPPGDRTLAGRPARSPRHPGHTEGAELPPGGRRQLLHAPPARAIKGKAQNQPPPGPFRRLSPPALENHLTSPPPPGKGEERRPTPAAGAAGPTVGRGPQPATPTPGSAAQETRPQEGRGPRGSCLAWCRRALRPRLRVWSNQRRNRKRTKGGPRLAGFARSPVLGSPPPRPARSPAHPRGSAHLPHPQLWWRHPHGAGRGPGCLPARALTGQFSLASQNEHPGGGRVAESRPHDTAEPAATSWTRGRSIKVSNRFF